jgi:hypothetical protein
MSQKRLTTPKQREALTKARLTSAAATDAILRITALEAEVKKLKGTKP